MKTNVIFRSVAFGSLLVVCSAVFGQDTKAAVQAALEAQYPLTQPTGDNVGVVSTGALLVLLRNAVDMVQSTAQTNPFTDTYKGGKVSSGGFGHLADMTNMIRKRTFVKGEKMYVTKIQVKDDGIYFNVFTDPIDDIRYKGLVKFPFPKNPTLTPEQAQSLVAEVFSLDATAPMTSQASAPPQAAPKQQSQAESVAAALPPPIAPPPPPPDQSLAAPPTVAINQTKEQVEASLGKPDRVVQAKRKEIYFYKNMKVTFTDGKVSQLN